jgi:hypothetical protein
MLKIGQKKKLLYEIKSFFLASYMKLRDQLRILARKDVKEQLFIVSTSGVSKWIQSLPVAFRGLRIGSLCSLGKA